ncbi:L-lysine exporter family protein LysE/ArgO [Salirhabdus euzebyi]|uniref:L-lysine exporter family protein LysE/ArgO n=1 Tax=Salirhabdus euzebyi TaxID=394506 RepID=A0A841Q3Y4_9BACI|nr:LysE/ArgO family amino acid transporter [Salirhabdus euzebyi]MBB6453121.1 L-lysine exporter family protein LysE/ArgO [Salirhabdus euzebyi]
MIEAFLHGIVLAFGLILPLGVQNVFIFNQGATQPSFYKALPAIVTASLCDSLMIIGAITGLSVIIYSFEWLKTFILFIGILFLIYMAWSLWKTKASTINSSKANHLSAKKQILFAASVSLLNPHAILDIIGVIGTSSLAYESSEKWLFTFSTILVSWLWFFGLALLGRLTRQVKNYEKYVFSLNKLSAVIVLGTAVYLVIRNI